MTDRVSLPKERNVIMRFMINKSIMTGCLKMINSLHLIMSLTRREFILNRQMITFFNMIYLLNKIYETIFMKFSFEYLFNFKS